MDTKKISLYDLMFDTWLCLVSNTFPVELEEVLVPVKMLSDGAPHLAPLALVVQAQLEIICKRDKVEEFQCGEWER
jgi:hypothetical protein